MVRENLNLILPFLLPLPTKVLSVEGKCPCEQKCLENIEKLVFTALTKLSHGQRPNPVALYGLQVEIVSVLGER